MDAKNAGVSRKRMAFVGLLVIALTVVITLSHQMVGSSEARTPFDLYDRKHHVVHRDLKLDLKHVDSTKHKMVEDYDSNELVHHMNASSTYNVSLWSKIPSIVGTAITTQEIDENLRRCRASSIARDKSCQDVHRNSTLYWRSIKTTGFTQQTDFSRMTLAVTCCAFNHTELMFPNPSGNMFPWERDYLSQGPMTNMAYTAWATKSSVELDNNTNKNLSIGDKASFIIRIRTGQGKPRKIGGDSVRLWLVNKDLGASVTAIVKDLGDGSYLATSKLPWAGKAVVRATIAHTRELFRATLYVQRLFTTSHWLTATFKNPKASEATPCSPLPFLPGFLPSEICNLTEFNGGNVWYCGKPVKKALSCQDIAGIVKIRHVSALPLSKADEDLVKLTESNRPFLIPTKIELTVNKKPSSNLTTLPVPSLECRKRDLTTTFKETTSTGYFYKKKWRPFVCQIPVVDTQFSNNCLKNTTVILIGDSNTREQMYSLQHLTKCTEKIKRTQVKWHAPLRCDIDRIGMSIQYFPHMNPFYGSMNELITKKHLTSTIHKLDSIPSTGRYVILLHYFLHFMPFHLSVAKTRLQAVRPAIQRLLDRNHLSYLIIQSPHSAYDHSVRNKHKLNIFLFQMTKSILSGLGKRVMFVDTMDLTIANENSDGHPSIAAEFMNLYLGHLCGRW